MTHPPAYYDSPDHAIDLRLIALDPGLKRTGIKKAMANSMTFFTII